MKKLIVLVAFAGLVAACHRGEYRGGAGTETGTYQGTTGSEGWNSSTNTNAVINPQGGMGPGTEKGPSKDVHPGDHMDTGAGDNPSDATPQPDIDTGGY